MIFCHATKSVLLQPQGRLDAQGGSTLRTQLEAIAPEHHDLWIVDLSEVDFIDSLGLVSLIQGLKRAKKYGCRLVVCSLRASAKLVFEITSLDQAFEIFEDYATALGPKTPSIALREADLVPA